MRQKNNVTNFGSTLKAECFDIKPSFSLHAPAAPLGSPGGAVFCKEAT